MTQYIQARSLATLLSNLALLSSLALSMLISGCSGGSGSSTESNPDTSSSSDKPSYTGPAPASEDVQNYKIHIWDNLSPENRCGACHTAGGQSPRFVRADDINSAYSASSGLINLSSPASSRLVTKVGGGHNCWLNSTSACAEIITNYIEAWAVGSGSLVNTVSLTAPIVREIGDSKTFPDDNTAFATNVYTPLLSTYCSGCHSDDAATPIQPYFASSDVDIAYAAAKSKMDLDTPSNSRFSLRLGSEFHNCWSSCNDNANTMTAAIAAFANSITLTQVDPALITSKALRLTDGIVASSGGRIENNAIALYEFKSGVGSTAYDTSGVNPSIDLSLSGNVEWIGSWGLRFNGGKAQGPTASSRKLFDNLTTSAEYSVEAWIAPANVTQEGPARIVTYSGGDTSRNFTLGQSQYNYDFLNRSDTTGINGTPALSTLDAEERLQATLQHVVVTYSATEGRKIYVNGEDTGVRDMGGVSSIQDWDETFALAIGSEVSNDDVWLGSMRLLAIHSKALTPEDIQTNFDAGVGEKFFLLFNVADHTGINDSYIWFEVEQYDSYSFLFSRPTFIILDANARPGNIRLEGMRIGINGREASIGQSYSKLKLDITDSLYSSSTGQRLSDLGTLITLEKGAENDEFFLTFDRLDSNTYNRTITNPPAPPEAADLNPQSHIGLRRFAQINASLSDLTTVISSQSSVQTTYNNVRQQLPSDSNIGGFLTAHQMGVTQLAVSYCNALVSSSSLRSSYFPSINFTANANTELNDVSEQNNVIDPLLEHLLAHDINWPTGLGGGTSALATQPSTASSRTELQSLMNIMLCNCDGACGSELPTDTCNSDDTKNIILATCAAATGSAMMLIH